MYISLANVQLMGAYINFKDTRTYAHSFCFEINLLTPPKPAKSIALRSHLRSDGPSNPLCCSQLNFDWKCRNTLCLDSLVCPCSVIARQESGVMQVMRRNEAPCRWIKSMKKTCRHHRMAERKPATDVRSTGGHGDNYHPFFIAFKFALVVHRLAMSI